MGMDPLLVTARTRHQNRVKKWLEDPTPEREPFVILSTAASSGLSIDTDGAGKAAYPHVFLEMVVWPGGLPLDVALQMAARVRGAPTLSWFAPAGVAGSPPAQVRLAEMTADAWASATVLGTSLRTETALDGLVATRCANDARSLGSSPRDALADGLTGDGWQTIRCEPMAADEPLRWHAAKESAVDTYITDLQSAGRGPVDQEMVTTRLRELGLPPTSAALLDDEKDGVTWLEREHRRRTPMNLLVTLVSKSEAREFERKAMSEFASGHDLPHGLLTCEMVEALLRAANVDVAALVRGESISVRSTDLAGFANAADRYREPLVRLLDIQAPKGARGAVRCFASVMSRIGGEKLPVRRPAEGDRTRVYTFQLHKIALATLDRRLGRTRGEPEASEGLVFRRAEADALAARVPVRMLPEAADHLVAIDSRMAAATDPAEKTRLNGVVGMVSRALLPAAGGLIAALRWRRADSGRLQLLNEPLQTMPKSLRHLIVPLDPGDAFVSADWRSCHVVIAAARTADPALGAVFAAADAYERLAERFLPDISQGRGTMKRVLLAMLNGAGPAGIGHIVGERSLGRVIHRALLAEFRQLQLLFAEAKRLQAEPEDFVDIPTLTGRIYRIKKRREAGGWRRILSAFWTGTESEALGNALAKLPIGARLVAPMHDGLLVCCRREDAERISRDLRLVMTDGARAAGFDPGVKIGVGETWAEAENTAR